MSVLTIDSSAINAKKTQFKNEGTKFNSNAYNTFKTGYISTCSDSTVQRMKSNLNTLYKAIENGYKEINNYWDNYLKDFDSLENSLKSFSASCSNATVNSYLSGMSDLLPQVPKKATSFVKIKNVNYKADEGNSKKGKTKSGLSSILEGIGIGANTVISGAKSGLTKVKNGIADAYSKVSNKANVVISKAKSGLGILKSGAKMAGNFIKNSVKAQIETDKIIISTTGSVLKHVGQGMINWGENLWCFLLKGGGGNPISAGLIRSYNNNLLQLGDIIISDSKTLKDFDFYIDLPFYSTANENNDYVNDMIKDIKGGDDLVDSFDTTKIAKKMEKTSLVKNDSVVASVGEGVGEAIPTIALAYLTGGGSLAMGTVGYATGSGEGYANALLDGATTNEAELSSNIKGALSGISWYIGGELNQTGVAKSIATKLGISAKVAEKPITSSAIRVIGDALDGASTPFTDSISKLVYAKGYTDKDGNYKEFTKDDNVFDRYKKIFEENGGWKSAGIGAIIGGGLSGVNEAVDFSFKRGDYGVDFDTNKTKTNGNEGFDNTGKNTDGNYKNKTDGDTGKTNNKTNTDNNTKTDEKFKETKKVKSEGEIMAELREKLDRGEITKKEYYQKIKEIHPDNKIHAEEAAKKAKNVDNNVKNTDTTNAKQTNTKDVNTKYTDDSWDVSKKVVASDEKAVTKYKEVGDMTTKNDINTKVTKNINTTNDSKWTINNRQISPDQDIKIKDVEMNTDASVKAIDGGTTKTDYSNMSESELRQRIKDLEAERTKIDESIEKISNDTSTWHKDYEKMGKYIDLTDELNEAKAALAMKNSANNTPKLGTDKPNVFLEKKPDPTPLLDGGGALSTGATAAKLIGDNIDDVNVNVDKSFNKPIKIKELEEFYNQFPAQRRGVNQDIVGLTMENNPTRTIDYINQVKKTFPDLSDADALKLLENMNRNKSGLCSYAASLNTTLVSIGESIPDFKKKFGYDFSRTTAGGYKVLNDDLMLIDLYCYLNKNLVKDGKYVGGSAKNFNYLMESKYTVNGSDMADWLKTKGIDAKIEVKTIKNNFMDLPEDFSLSTEVKKELSDGNQVLVMVNTSDANKLVLHMDEVNTKGEKINVDQSLFGGGHFLTVIGMKDSDTFIVQSWGKRYDVKVSDLEKVMTGAFSVDSTIKTTSNLNKTIDKINVKELNFGNNKAKGFDIEHLYNTYKEYDNVYLAKNNIEDIMNDIKVNNTSGKSLIVIDNTNSLTDDVIKNMPENVEVRITGGYTDDYLKGFKFGASGEKTLEHVTFNKNELTSILNEMKKFDAGIDPNWSQIEKAKYAYDYLTNKLKYNPHPGGSMVRAKQHDGLSSLIKGESTCQGFAETYKQLLERMGIESTTIGGSLNNVGHHAYVIVNIDGNPFVVDTVRPFLESKIGESGFNVNPNEYFAENNADLLDKVKESYKKKIVDVSETSMSNSTNTSPNNEIFGFFKKKKTDVDIFAKRPPTHTEVYRDLKIMSDSADGLQRLKNYVDQLDKKGSQTFRSAYFLSKIRESGAIITNICDPNEAFFNTSTRVVHLGDNVINNNQIETIFHELGHKVDNMNYYYEQGKTIVNYSLRDISKDTINNGFEKFRKDYNTYYNKLWSDIYVNDSFKNRITKETNERYYSLYDKYDKKVYNEIEKNVKFELLDTILRESGYSTISDIFDALKQGEVHDKYKMPGHGKKYYDPNKGGYSFSTEIIANFSSLYNSNKTDMLDNYLPSSFREKITNGYEDLIDISHTKVTLDSYKFYNSNLPKQILAYLSDENINHIESGSSAKAAIQSMSKTELMKYITSQESYASILDYAKEITDKKYGNGNFVKNLTNYLSTKNSNLLTRDNNIRDYISYLSPDQIRIWLKRDRAISTKFYKPGDLD